MWNLGSRPVVVDGLDAAAVGAAVANAEPDVIVHQMTTLAGSGDLKHFDRTFAATNRLRTVGTDNLLAAAQAVGVPRVIAQSFAGWPNERSGGPVKSETDPFDADPPRRQRATLAAIRHLERAVLAAPLDGVVVRYGIFYGPGASDDLVALVRKGRLPIVGSGPVERAMFLLHDVFGYEFAEIASIVGRSADNCRQVAVRARRHVNAQRPRFEASREQRERLADRFVAAVLSGEVDALIELLAADVVVTGDSGGMSPSWPRIIAGRDKVARLLGALSLQIRQLPGAYVERAEVNGQPGAVVRGPDGALVNVFSFEIADGAVQAIRSVINRDKLRHLGPLADLPALLAQRRLRGGH